VEWWASKYFLPAFIVSLTFLPDRKCNNTVYGFSLLIKGVYFQMWQLKCDTQPCAHLENEMPMQHTNLQWLTFTLQSECPQTIICLISFTIHPSSNAAGSVVVASSRKCCEWGIKLPALRTATKKKNIICLASSAYHNS
jgi:hypothetical protein